MVISAPSGTGKTTLCRRVMQRLPNVEFSVSHTTRAPRGQEQNGVDYHFVDDHTFTRMVEEEAFLEWAHVYNRRYGTHRATTEARLAAGKDLLFDIDVQGGKNIAARLPNTVLVYVLPPSLAELERRLRRRASDSEEQVQRRLRLAREEIQAAAPFYTHWIVNDDLERAVEMFSSILIAERLRRQDVGELLRRVLGEG